MDEDFLEHFGVKGMKWGQSKAPMTRGEKFKRGAKIAGGVAVIAGAAFIAYKISKGGSGNIPISSLSNSPKTKLGQTNAYRLMNSKAMQQPVSGIKKVVPTSIPKVVPRSIPKVSVKSSPSPTPDQMAKFLKDQQDIGKRISSQLAGERSADRAMIGNTAKLLRKNRG